MTTTLPYFISEGDASNADKLQANFETLANAGGLPVNLVPKGAYAAGTTYDVNDSVSYGGSSYVAIAETTGNLPTDTTYWQLLAEKGDTGATGAKGDKGDTGNTGATGASIITGAFVGDDLVFTKDDTNTVTIEDAKVDLKGDQGIQGIQGIQGPAGTNGTDGEDGLGVPAGGSTAQILRKIDGTDNNTEWSDQPYNSSLARQAIINGNFDVWQRGTTLTPGATDTAFIADRYLIQQGSDGGTLPTIVHSKAILTSGDIYNSLNYYNIAPNGAGTSLGNGSYGFLAQKIEHGTSFLAGLNKKVTVSFWAKSDIANKRLGISLYQNYGTGGSPSAQEIINGTTITLTSTWTKYTYTFTTNTLVGKTFGTDNNDHFRLVLGYQWGSTYQARFGSANAETYVGSGNIGIAQVQLCAGDVALPFMPKSFENELRACMRYYEKTFNYATVPANNLSTVGASIILTYYNASLAFGTRIYFLVPKRNTGSTITYYSYGNNPGKWEILGGGGAYTMGTSYLNEFGFQPGSTNDITSTRYVYGSWVAENEL